MRILLVESPEISTLSSSLGQLLPTDTKSTFTYEIHTARDVREALQLYQSVHPDLVLIDLRSQEDRAKDLCRTIRDLEATRHTGIMFLAQTDKAEDFAVECLEIGADDVVRVGTSDREILARVNAVLKLKVMTDELRSANHRLQQLSFTDELTGLANMRAFNGRYSKIISDVAHGLSAIGVIMLDLDHFKSVNDSNDHLMGSHVIAEVGRLIRKSNILGHQDCAARFGGDEYVIFTDDTTAEDVAKKAEDIRSMIQKAVFIKDGKSVNISCSVGVSWTAKSYDGKAEDPIKAADLMLYESKRMGRNRVSLTKIHSAEDMNQLCDHIQTKPKISKTGA